MFTGRQRDALLFTAGSENNPFQHHLFILLTDPVGPPQQVLIVSVTSFVRGRALDPACILHAGDHEFITHDSYVLYSRCRIERISTLNDGIRSRQFVPKFPVRQEIFDQIVEGLSASRQTPRHAGTFYQDYLSLALMHTATAHVPARHALQGRAPHPLCFGGNLGSLCILHAPSLGSPLEGRLTDAV